MNWFAFLFVTVGNILVGNRGKFGFILIAFGSVLWTVIGFKIEDFALALVNIFGIIIMTRNWRKWKMEEKYWHSMFLPEYRIRWWQIWR
ncbi:MAG: hypothetical protein HYX22_03065 [Candidatus Yanofskybacteria bacterium]|nr:hypothetical protein [Candidatus Yanofskybacteria bacterium]